MKGKHAGGFLGDEWQLKASSEPEVIRRQFAAAPGANVGILPDRALVPLDVDDPESFQRLQEDACPAPPTPRYLTGGGPARERLLFAYDDRIDHADRKLGDGVQLRHGSSLMSVVPPSVHPDTGVELEWTIALDEVPLAQIPEQWLARVIRRNGKPMGRPKSEWADLFTRTFISGCGETHPSFVSMAGRLVPVVGAAATFELLRCWNLEHCTPAKPEDEIHDAVAWVARKELGR